MNIGMRWNQALIEMRRLAVTDGALGELKTGRLVRVHQADACSIAVRVATSCWHTVISWYVTFMHQHAAFCAVYTCQSLHFRQWPRAWQTQPWCAQRAQGGPLREVGTHFFFGIHELFGHGSATRVKATVTYPDGVCVCLSVCVRTCFWFPE